MANKNSNSAAYLSFIEDLNEILVDIEVSKLSFS